MTVGRLRKVHSSKELDTVVDDYITQGYRVQSVGQKSTRLRKSQWGSMGGHLLVALLTIWWTIGFGNLTYALIAHSSSEKVLVKLEAE